MKLREVPSDALSDEINGSDRIARQTSRIPPRLGEVASMPRCRTAVATAGPSSKAALSLGIDATVVSGPAYRYYSSLRRKRI